MLHQPNDFNNHACGKSSDVAPIASSNSGTIEKLENMEESTKEEHSVEQSDKLKHNSERLPSSRICWNVKELEGGNAISGSFEASDSINFDHEEIYNTFLLLVDNFQLSSNFCLASDGEEFGLPSFYLQSKHSEH